MSQDKYTDNKSEAASIISDANYRALVENADDGILLTDLKGNTLYRNAAYFRQLGFKVGDSEAFAKIHPDDLQTIREKAKDFLLTGFSSVEYRVRNREGNWVNRFSKSTLIYDEQKQPSAILSIIRDITQQKAAEEQIKQLEEQHRTFLSSANVLIQSVSSDGKFLYVNPQWKKSLGYSDSDLQTISLGDVVHGSHLSMCMSLLERVVEGESLHDVETVFVTKQGDEISVSGNICPIFKDGKFTSTIGYFVDITKRKQAEEQLRQTNKRIELMNEKLRVVGSLTRHDVRNKLSTVTGQAYILKKKHSDISDVAAGVSLIEKAVAESVKIFEFAKLYEQLGAEELVYVNVEEKLNESCTLFSTPIPDIINECQGLIVLADSFLRQMFFNLIDNTRKYGQKATQIRVYYRIDEQENLNVFYEDNGVGVALENKLHLFKEGFSTGGSTGFGLFLIKKMVELYGWQIQEDGKPGKGARFTIIIPRLGKDSRTNYLLAKEAEPASLKNK